MRLTGLPEYPTEYFHPLTPKKDDVFCHGSMIKSAHNGHLLEVAILLYIETKVVDKTSVLIGQKFIRAVKYEI